MIILVNPQAGGGTAVRKLESIGGILQQRCGPCTVIQARSREEVRAIVASRFRAGERAFAAAGGDGSVNAVMTAIMTHIPAGDRTAVALGAIGLGSSNDFHKPFSRHRMIGRTPCMVDFSSAQLRDVVALTVESNGGCGQRYCMVNASVGLTAEGNRSFNTPDPLLARLKHRATGPAILYAAAQALFTFRDLSLTLGTDETNCTAASVTNLALFKSPHISGGFRFPEGEAYDSGMLQLHLAAGLNLYGRLRLFLALAAGRAPKGRSFRAWRAAEVTLSSDTPFPVEFDGEVMSTRRVRFTVLPQQLRVCRW